MDFFPPTFKQRRAQPHTIFVLAQVRHMFLPFLAARSFALLRKGHFAHLNHDKAETCFKTRTNPRAKRGLNLRLALSGLASHMRSLGGAGDGNDKCSSLKVAHERSGYPCPAGELLRRQRPSSSPGKKRKPTSKKRFFASRAEERTHKAD
jgi:hypothetical protein